MQLHATDTTPAQLGYTLLVGLFGAVDLAVLRNGVEAAVRTAVARAARPGAEVTTTVTPAGHCVQHVQGTSIHWEPDTAAPTVRNLRPVTPIDPRLHALWADPRLTRPAAEQLGVTAVAPLTSKISFKRAEVGSEFIWHQDYTFLHRFLGPRAAEAVTVMIFLDDADAGNGALTLLPGSHLGPPRPDGEDPQPDDVPVTVEARAGSVVVFPTLMLHRSDPNHSVRDRRAMLLLYQPAGRPHLDESRTFHDEVSA